MHLLAVVEFGNDDLQAVRAFQARAIEILFHREACSQQADGAQPKLTDVRRGRIGDVQ